MGLAVVVKSGNIISTGCNNFQFMKQGEDEIYFNPASYGNGYEQTYTIKFKTQKIRDQAYNDLIDVLKEGKAFFDFSEYEQKEVEEVLYV